MGCKSNYQIMEGEFKMSWALTMWDVNGRLGKIEVFSFEGWALTMWDVNESRAIYL